MVIFNSYVKLPEGILLGTSGQKTGIPCQWEVSHLSSSSKCDEIAWRKREEKNISTTHETNQAVGGWNLPSYCKSLPTGAIRRSTQLRDCRDWSEKRSKSFRKFRHPVMPCDDSNEVWHMTQRYTQK